MQEKRKRTAREILVDESSIHTARCSSTSEPVCTSAHQKKRCSPSRCGAPRPHDSRDAVCASLRVELLDIVEVTATRQAAAKENVKTRYQPVCSARESLRAFSRSDYVDATRAAELRLQKLWSSPSEVMAFSRATTTSEMSQSRPTAQMTYLSVSTGEEKPNQLKMGNAAVGHAPKPKARDWRAAVSNLPRDTDSKTFVGDGEFAVRVFADRSLWTTITEFMTGLPFVVLQFEKDAAPKYTVRTREVSYVSKVFFALDEINEWFPKSIGLLPQLAIAEDNLGILQLLFKLHQSPHYRAHPKLHFGQVLRCAIWFKCWKILQWLVRVLPCDREWQWEPDLMSFAVFQRNLALMSWLFAKCPDESIMLSARQVEIRESGDLEMVKWLHDHGYSFSVWMMNAAAAKGSLSVVRFLHKHRSEGCTTDAMDLAARYGHFEVVKFLHEHRKDGYTSKALDAAAQNGHIEVVKFLLENREEDCIASAIIAAEGNRQHEHAPGAPPPVGLARRSHKVTRPKYKDGRCYKQEPTRKQLHTVYHFAKCLSDAVKEFEATDTSTAEERFEYNPVLNWGDYPISRGAAVGYYNSLIDGYIELNLIPSDPKVFTPLMVNSGNQKWTEAMRVMCGVGDGSHAEWLVELISPAFERNRHDGWLKSPTAEVLQLLRDHSARRFRCMYSISGCNRIHDVDLVMMVIMGRFDIDNELQTWRYRDYPGPMQPLMDFFTSTE